MECYYTGDKGCNHSWNAIILEIKVWEYIEVYYIPCVDVVWLEPPAFQEELVKSPTSHNFVGPILHNIVVTDIFAWFYLVSTEQITNRMSLQIIEIGYSSSEMDRGRYSGNCLFKMRLVTSEFLIPPPPPPPPPSKKKS